MPPQELIGLITGSTGGIGFLVVIITLLFTDKLHTDPEFKRTIGIYKEALQAEREAHAETKRALVAASDRADSAVRFTELIANSISKEPRRRRETKS